MGGKSNPSRSDNSQIAKRKKDRLKDHINYLPQREKMASGGNIDRKIKHIEHILVEITGARLITSAPFPYFIEHRKKKPF